MNKIILALLMVLICSPAFSATQLKKTVCPSGCDYTSLESAMNANEQNLVTADKYFDVEISGTWSSADTTAVTIHNYTTDATRYINIYTTGSARHDGKWSTTAYRLVINWGMALIARTTINNIDGLQVQLIGGQDNYALLEFGEGNYSGGGGRISNNILKTSTTGTQGHTATGIIARAFGTHYIYNNIIYGFLSSSTSGFSAGIKVGNSRSTAYIYNNTIYNCDVGILEDGTTAQLLKNNIAYNNEADYSGTFSSASTNNLSKDTSAPAYNTYYVSKTLAFTNTTAGSEDFHLVAGDTDAIDKGADLSGTFTTDIDGTTRTGTWDIGADEYVSAVTPSLPSVFEDFYVTSGSDVITFN